MSRLPSFLSREPSGLSQSSDPNSPSSEQRSDAKNNFLKSMRPLPTQHYWNVYFDQAPPKQNEGEEYTSQLEQLGSQIESVQDFWRYANNTPVEQIKMRESIYLFKQGFKPIWEDRRNLMGGSWTFRVPKSVGPDFWTRVQLLAIGEKLQSVLDSDDQLCGVGLSVRFNSHLISIWHRDASKQNSIDNLLAAVLEEIPDEMRPKPENYFYKKHSDHAGFKAPPGFQAVLDSQKKAEAQKQTQKVSPVEEEPEAQ